MHEHVHDSTRAARWCCCERMTNTGGAPVFVVQAARHASAWLLVQVVLRIGQSRERCTAGCDEPRDVSVQ